MKNIKGCVDFAIENRVGLSIIMVGLLFVGMGQYSVGGVFCGIGLSEMVLRSRGM